MVFFSKSADLSARALSNFAPSPLLINGRWFPTVEHYYQAAKIASAGYVSVSHAFSTVGRDDTPQVGPTGLDAKKAAGKAHLLKDHGIKLDASDLERWKDAKRIDAMLTALREKFKMPEFATILLATKERPLHHFERQPDYWGMHTTSKGEKKGMNMLGSMLEGIRKILVQQAVPAAAAAAATSTPAAKKAKVCDHRDVTFKVGFMGLVEEWTCFACGVTVEDDHIPAGSRHFPRILCDDGPCVPIPHQHHAKDGRLVNGQVCRFCRELAPGSE